MAGPVATRSTPASPTSIVKALRKEAREDPEKYVTPRYGWQIVCTRCGRHSGLYSTVEPPEDDAQGHRDHRCPGPWLLEG